MLAICPSIDTFFVCVFHLPSVASPGRRVGGPLPNEAAPAARISQFSVCCSGRTSFLYIRRPGAAVSPGGPPASVIIAHFSKYGGCPSLQASPSRTIRNARVACRHGPSGLCLPLAYIQYKWHTPEPLAPSAFRTERTVPPPCADRASLSLSPSSSASTHPYSCLTALLTPPRWRVSQRPA